MTANDAKTTGQVYRVLDDKGSGKNFGFIRTADGTPLFFHQNDCVGKQLPAMYTYVRFFVVKEAKEGKCDRAIEIEPVK